MTEQSHSVSEVLQSLAPAGLPLYRAQRYDGGGFSVSLRQFAPEDISLIIQLYTAVKRTYDLWLYMKDAPNYKMLASHIQREFSSDQFLNSMRSIGAATAALGETSSQLRKIIHDIRGGALVVLVGYARLAEAGAEFRLDDLKTAVLNARDHAKLMRNAIDDIDPIVREADEGLKIHYIDDFVNKWNRVNFNIGEKTVAIKVSSSFEGSITNRCLETSAIDRILYNYVNNAARFSADKVVNMTIFPAGDSLVRWVVDNAISAEQQTWLDTHAGADLKKLFLGGLTRGGQGIGLTNCTDFVAASFGIAPQEALDKGYLGAKIIDMRYYAWFHWPAYIPKESEPDCEC